jgi:hypothetical protein
LIVELAREPYEPDPVPNGLLTAERLILLVVKSSKVRIVALVFVIPASNAIIAPARRKWTVAMHRKR